MSDDIGKTILGGINSAFGFTENDPQNPSNPYSYEALGDFASKINKADERVYLQSGYSHALKPQALEVLLQEPDVTIVVKKRQFSSLVENYQYDLLNTQEKVYLRAVKRLFYNKCRAIAAYERLTKLEKIATQSAGMLNNWLMPAIFSSVEILNTVSPGLIGGNTLETLDTLKKVKNFSDPSLYTTWLNPRNIPYLGDVGEGTGTFELTLAASVNTSVSTEISRGNASISFENPLELMIITQKDIEQAISDVVGFTNNQFFTYTQGLLNETNSILKKELYQIRLARGVAQINVEVNPNSLNFKKVRAFIEGDREIIFSYDPGLLGFGSAVELDASALQGVNGLQPGKETTILKDLITNIYSLIDNQNTTRNEIRNFNTQNSDIRKRMRLEFEDRAIIQQQDVVHVFMGSKTNLDPKVSEGFNFSYAKSNLLNNIDKGFSGVMQSLKDFAAVFSGADSGETFIEAEKNAIAGPDFPLWLWFSMRNDFTRQAAGTHVFAGVVNSVGQNYNNGKYSVNVSCGDFTEYLQKSQINVKPSLDVVDASLYDPLTPFKTDYDPATGQLAEMPELLDDNVALLETKSTKILAGRKRGSNATPDTYKDKDLEILTPESPTAQLRNQFFDSDGFVYRWKQGIGTLVLSGAPNSFGTGSLRKETSSIITNNAFSGQDVMNTLSLLITGQPYNYSTFLKSASKSGFLESEKYLGFNSSDNYLKGLIKDLNKSNAIWGNFVPFKKIALTNDAYKKLLQGELDITRANQELSDLIRQRAEKWDSIATVYKGASPFPFNFFGGSNNIPVVDPSILGAVGPQLSTSLSSEIYDLNFQINQKIQEFSKSFSDVSGNIKIFGDDVSVDGAVENYGVSAEDQLRQQEQFRKKLFHLTQRRLWKVKANEDQNYFIVDDSYDKNYDLQAFEDALGNLELFRSAYQSVSELVQNAAAILGLEIFADSQGHINARPPAYNRIPSSVFFKLIQDKDRKGIKLFPDYLESLFFNQVRGLSDQIEILEDQIRIRAFLLGATDDTSAARLLSGNFGSASNGSFTFLTIDGTFQGSESVQKLLQLNQPDAIESINRQALTELSSLVAKPNKTSINFDIVQRINALQAYNPVDNGSGLVSTISLRLKSKGFIDPIMNDLGNLTNRISSQGNALELLSQVASMVSERQSVIRLLSNAIKNLEEGTAINKDPDAARFPLFSTFNQSLNNGKIPEILLHMVEDENVHDLGPNSGSRYIIRDVDLISFDITENPPPFTAVEVNGSIANSLVDAPGSTSIGSGGNLLSTAYAADYDMWRLYGFKRSQPVSAAYLSDPVSQCAPFAVFLLNQARKNVLNATITIRGNEYMQAGEVYYLECRDLLVYAASVDHNFSFSGNFTTTIKGTYVRKPGEFIPTMLDIIGKGLYTRRNQANLVKNIRNNNPSTDVAIAALKFIPPDSTTEDAEEEESGTSTIFGSAFGEYNRKAIANILLASTGILTPSKYGEKIKIQIRCYYNKDQGFTEVDSKLKKFAEDVKSALSDPQKFFPGPDGTYEVSDKQSLSLNQEDIEVYETDLGTQVGEEVLSPSTKAWNIARSMALNSEVSQSDLSTTQYADKLKNNLFKHVIDVWASAQPNTDSGSETSNSNEVPNTEDYNNQREKFISDFNKGLGFK
jgi:hypothetical protein